MKNQKEPFPKFQPDKTEERICGDYDQNFVESGLEAGIRFANQVLLNSKTLKKERYATLLPPGYKILEFDAQLEKPMRKTGKRVFNDPESFCWYVNKHRSEDCTVLIADEEKGEVHAVINDHGADHAEWGDFAPLLRLGFSDQWETWLRMHNHRFSQAAFADFIEDNRSDLKTGKFERNGEEVENLSPLQLTKIVENMQLLSEENTVSKVDRRMGDVTINYESVTREKNQIKLPEALYLAIPIYKGGDLWKVKVRLRIQKQGPLVQFYYLIDQVPLLKRAAFDEICLIIEKGKGEDGDGDGDGFKGIELPVLRGAIDC